MSTAEEAPFPTGAKVPGVPAPYGRACTNCSHAKCRCIFRLEGKECERCFRLKKECIPSVSVRKKNGKRAVNSRTAHLEEKLADLVTLLKTQAANGQIPESASSVLNNLAGISTPSPSSHTQSPYSQGEDVSGRTPASSNAKGSGPAVGSQSTPRSSQPHVHPPFCPSDQDMSEQLSVLSSPLEPGPTQAQELLVLFRNKMLPYLPVVFIPESMTAQELRTKSPFLWFNIMAITVPNVDQQADMGDRIKQFVAQKIIIEHEKNMDLLLGLLVFISWTHFHKNNRKVRDRTYLSTFSSLVQSLIYDLELNRSGLEGNSVMACFKAAEFSTKNFTIMPQPKKKKKTLEGRRTVLAFFYISSGLSYHLKRIDSLNWTPYLDECLGILTNEPEWYGDEQLAAMVKIQLIIDQVNKLSWHRDRHPTESYMSVLLGNLQTIKDQLGPSLQQNYVIQCALNHCEIVVRDSVLSRIAPSPNNPDFERHEHLMEHVRTLKRFWDGFFNIPTSDWMGMSFAFWGYIGHGLVSLFRLTMMVGDPAWDRRAIIQELDVFDMCERLASGFEKAGNACTLRRGGGPAGIRDDDVFVKGATIVRNLKNGWIGEFNKMNPSNETNETQGQGHSQGQGPAGQMSQTGEMGAADQHMGGVGLPPGGGLDFAPGSVPMNQWFPGMPMTMMTDAAWLTDLFNVSWE